MEQIRGGTLTLLIIGAHVSFHLQYIYDIAMLIKTAVQMVCEFMYQLEFEKKKAAHYLFHFILQNGMICMYLMYFTYGMLSKLLFMGRFAYSN